MQNRDVEQRLKGAVGRLAPDALEDILAKCDKYGRDESPGNETAGNVYVMQTKRPRQRFARVFGAAAAACVLIFAGLSFSHWIEGRQVDVRVMLDVNPSIELQVNKSDRVLAVDAKNEDAVRILDNMDLKNTPIDVAINALIGSMLKYGYIQENANSVLLSVESLDGEKSAVLQKNLSDSISQQLGMVNGAVISQNLTNDGALQNLAEQYQISYGKAALVQKILDKNSHLMFADLAQLSVNELNLLVGSKRIEADGMEARGSASDTDYVGEEKAKQTALAHAGLSESQIERLYIELDFDDGRMVYDVEFYHNSNEYEYEIGASDGAVLQYDQEKHGQSGQGNNSGSGGDGRTKPQSGGEAQQEPQSQSKDDFIGEDKAVEIARNHAGAGQYSGRKVELDKDDGLYIYEVKFYAGGVEYEYEINATTGGIVSWESD